MRPSGFFWLFLAVAGISAPGRLVRAEMGHVRLMIEPAAANITVPSGNNFWGPSGSASVAVGLSDLIGLQARFTRARVFGVQPVIDATLWDATLTYNIDLDMFAPFAEVGGGLAELSQGNTQVGPTLVPLFGVGCDLKTTSHLVLGVGVRYHAVLNSALLQNPAFITVGARLGIIFAPF